VLVDFNAELEFSFSFEPNGSYLSSAWKCRIGTSEINLHTGGLAVGADFDQYLGREFELYDKASVNLMTRAVRR